MLRFATTAAIIIAPFTVSVKGMVVRELKEFASVHEMQQILSSSPSLADSSESQDIPEYVEAYFPSEVVARLHRLENDSEQCATDTNAFDRLAAQVKTMYDTSKPHTDCFTKDQKPVSDETVSFIFLNSNPDAAFVHGDQRVAVEAGKLVTFRGDEVHNTVIDRGFVRLAGPISSGSMLKVHVLLNEGDSKKEDKKRENKEHDKKDKGKGKGRDKSHLRRHN